MDFSKQWLILFCFIIAFSFVTAEEFLPKDEWFEEDGLETPAPVKASKPAGDYSHIKWAWDLPRYADTYAHLNRVPWIEPNTVTNLRLSLSHRREEDNQDNYQAIVYGGFRPIAFHYDDFSLAMGISFIARVNKVHDIDKVQDVNINGINATVTAEDIRAEAQQGAVNFSILASFPKASFQILFDIGYGFSKVRETIDPITIDAGAAVGEIDDYEFQQHDRGMYVGVNFLKSFDRDFFNFVRLFVYSAGSFVVDNRDSKGDLISNVAGNVEDSGRQDLPFLDNNAVQQFFFADPQLADFYRIGFVAADLEIRLFTIYTPYVENRGISFTFYSSILHATGEILGEDFYGTRTRVGGTVGLFDAFSVRLAYVAEEGNDQNDGFEVRVSANLLALGRKVF